MACTAFNREERPLAAALVDRLQQLSSLEASDGKTAVAANQSQAAD